LPSIINHQSINHLQMFHQIESKLIEGCLEKWLGDAWIAKARTQLVHVLEKIGNTITQPMSRWDGNGFLPS
jgi:hypothetical protein